MLPDADRPAFPTPNWPGVTIRDWFAAQCLPDIARRFLSLAPHEIASRAYDQADAMLRTRAQG